jgi:hypothetical protein
MVMMRMISIIFGVAAVAVLSALISQSPGNSVPNEKLSAANESTSSTQINAKGGNSAEVVQAGSNEHSAGIRAVDFANYSYSAAAVYTNRKTFTLEDGTYEGLLIPGCKGSASDCHEPVSLVAQTYGDVTGDGVEEAMVVLAESIRGSAIPYYIYVFGIEKKRLKLLWAVATGDRAEGGLRKVYSENGELVIELYGNGTRVNGDVFAGEGNGACCPLSITRTRYRRSRNHFVQHGRSEVFRSNGNGAPFEMEYRQPD